MALTPYMSLDLPVPTVTIGPAWASMLNAAVQIIDAHDHANGAGKQVPSAGINVDADLDFNNNGLLGSRILSFTDQTSVAETNCFYTDGGELHFVDGVGNDIQITIGGGLNASTIGGIGGDYGLGGSVVTFSNTSNTYFFYDNQASPSMASVDVASIFIREPNVANAKYIKLKSPATLAADYELTLLTGLPASTLPLSISAAGVMSTGQILTAQIADLNVTTGKLADLNVTTAKIADDNVTAGKLDPNANVATMIREVFTSSGTWTKPSGFLGSSAIVRACGGGGGGGGGAGATTENGGAGGGGGGGSPFYEVLLDVSSISSASVTIGTGGTGGAGGGSTSSGSAGSSGGDTTFGSLYTWKGAAGGGGGGVGSPGPAGTAGGGISTSSLINLFNSSHSGGVGGASSGAGSSGENSKFGTGGSGGAGSTDGGGGGGGGAGKGNGANGAPGSGDGGGAGQAGSSASANTGAGGGGGGASDSGAGALSGGAGGNGGSGYLEVIYWVNVNP